MAQIPTWEIGKYIKDLSEAQNSRLRCSILFRSLLRRTKPDRSSFQHAVTREIFKNLGAVAHNIAQLDNSVWVEGSR